MHMPWGPIAHRELVCSPLPSCLNAGSSLVRPKPGRQIAPTRVPLKETRGATKQCNRNQRTPVHSLDFKAPMKLALRIAFPLLLTLPLLAQQPSPKPEQQQQGVKLPDTV